MKQLLISLIRLSIFVMIIFIAVISCKKNASTSNNNTTTTETDSGGWTGTDTPSSVPQAINIANLSSATLPSKVDLTPYLPPVGNQGGTNTCVAWATGYYAKTASEAIAFNYSQNQLSNPSYQMSPLALFCEIPDNQKDNGKGAICQIGTTQFTSALNSLKTIGVATMAVVPWATPEINCSQSRVQSSWLTDGANHKIDYYRVIPATVQGIKQELASNIPVIVGIKESNEFKSFQDMGVITAATFPSKVGLHAQCIVGYDDNEGPAGAFRVVNSWGTTFKDNGFYWIDYNIMVNDMISNGNAYYMSTSSAQHNDTIPTQTTSSVVDIAPWVDNDVSTAASTGVTTSRRLYFNIYNIGGATASAGTTWNVYYAYVNAFNANDYGVIYHDQFNTSIASNSYSCATNVGCIFNYNIPAGSSLAKVSFGDPEVYRDYTVPNITGTYYLILVADLDNALGEKNLQNNIFYKSGQLPLTFSNGVTQSVDPASGAIQDGHKNDLEVNLKNLTHSKFNSAVSSRNQNAYTPEEIISFLKVKYRSGELTQKARETTLKHLKEKLMPQVH
jgi:papain like protease